MIYIDNTMVTTAKSAVYLGNAGVFFSDHDKRQPELSLLVSVQGKQYRRMVCFRGLKIPRRAEGKDQEELVRFIGETDEWKWMFGRDHEGGFFQSSGTREGFFKNRQTISTNQKKTSFCSAMHPVRSINIPILGKRSGFRRTELLRPPLRLSSMRHNFFRTLYT